MTYSTGYDLEKAVFGDSSDSALFSHFQNTGSEFRSVVQELIDKKGENDSPMTGIGKSLHYLVGREIDRLGISSEGLIFRSAINTKADFHHYLDGFFYLPLVPRGLVTVDLFNLSIEDMARLSDYWVDSFGGEYYSEYERQNDLFLYKTGASVLRKIITQTDTDPSFFDGYDIRSFSIKRRPEGHFVLTPYHLATYRSRRSFARLVAGYIVNSVVHHRIKEGGFS